MLSINAANLQYFAVAGAAIPCEGPRCVPLTNLDFSQSDSYIIDLENIVSRNYISMVQSLFIDNSANASPLQITIARTGQVIKIAPGHQAYKSVNCPNPASLAFSSPGGGLVNVQLQNFPTVNDDWPTF